jgi:hypothetical protein
LILKIINFLRCQFQFKSLILGSTTKKPTPDSSRPRPDSGGGRTGPLISLKIPFLRGRMSYHCQNCQSLFFKTLETRIAEQGRALFYKKRCKRCKYKYLLRKELSLGTIKSISYEEWTTGSRIASHSSRVSERPKILSSEYSQRISKTNDKTIDYLNKLDAVKGYEHGSSQALR